MAAFSWRKTKRQARRVLHDVLRVPAFYVVPATNAHIPCYVRIHNEHRALGGVKGTSFAYAEREDNDIEIIFMRDQIAPIRKGIVSVEPGEAYVVDHIETPDDITVTARVVRMDPSETASLPVPAGYDDSFADTYNELMFPRTNPDSSFFEAAIPTVSATTPVSLLAEEEWTVPLSSATIAVDQRSALLAGHDFFAGDRLRPFALNDEYFIRVDLVVRSFALANSVTMVLDIDGTEDEILTVHQAIPFETAGEEKAVSLFTRVFARDTFVANGAQMRIGFLNDVEITEARIYMSL